MLDRFYWLVIFVIYSTIFYKLMRWGWWRFFPWLSIFLGQQILFTFILLHYQNGSWGYWYASYAGKALDIVTGLLALIEVSRLRMDAITYTLAAYFMVELLIIKVAAPLHMYEAEQLIKPMVIAFYCVWLWNLAALKKRVDAEFEFS
jgi:hypothetical protein